MLPNPETSVPTSEFMSELSEIENELQLMNIMNATIPEDSSFQRSEIAVNQLQDLYAKNCTQNQSSPVIEPVPSSPTASNSSPTDLSTNYFYDGYQSKSR